MLDINWVGTWDQKVIPIPWCDQVGIVAAGDWSIPEIDALVSPTVSRAKAFGLYCANVRGLKDKSGWAMLDVEGQNHYRAIYVDCVEAARAACPRMKFAVYADSPEELPFDPKLYYACAAADATWLNMYQQAVETESDAAAEVESRIMRMRQRLSKPVIPGLSFEIGGWHPRYPSFTHAEGPLTHPLNFLVRRRALSMLSDDLGPFPAIGVWANARADDLARQQRLKSFIARVEPEMKRIKQLEAPLSTLATVTGDAA